MRRAPTLKPWQIAPLVALLVALALSPGCGIGSGDSEDTGPADPNQAKDLATLEVLPHKEPCASITDRLCFLVRAQGTEKFIQFPFRISGFLWQWGHRYLIEVAAIGESSDPESLYRLVRVITDEAVPEAATFVLDMSERHVTPNPRCDFMLNGEVPFRPRTDEVCTDLNRSLVANRVVRGRFSYTGQPDRPIILDSVSTSPLTDSPWAGVYLEQHSGTVSGGCAGPAKFTVLADGRTEYEKCAEHNEGRLSPEELRQLDILATAVAETDLSGPYDCDPSVQPEAPVYLDIKLPVGIVRRVYKATEPDGECFRGDRQKVNDLREYMTNLSARPSTRSIENLY